MAHFDLVQGDGGSAVVVTISDTETNIALNLTGKTVQLRYSLNEGATVEKTMTVLDQVNFPGQAQYQFLAADLSAPGALVGEGRIQDGQPDQLTTVDRFRLAVRAPLP